MEVTTRANDPLACGLLRTLVRRNEVSAEQALQLQEQAVQSRVSTVRIASRSLSLNWRQVAQAVAETYNTPLLDLSVVSGEPASGVADAAAVRLRAMDVWPLSTRGGRLWLGMADPGDIMVLQRAAQVSGLQITPVTVAADALMQALGHESTPTGGADERSERDTDLQLAGAGVVDAVSVERFLRRHVAKAIERGADTLHIEPCATAYRLRIRTADRFETLSEMPEAVGQLVGSTLQGLSVFDVALSSEHTVSFLVNCLTTEAGTRILMRRQLSPGETPSLESLGFEQTAAQALLAAIRRPSTAAVFVCSASQAQRQLALQALAMALDTPDEHVLVAGPVVFSGAGSCTQVRTPAPADPAFEDRIEAVLQHEPTRLVLSGLESITDTRTWGRLLQWTGTGRQLLAGLSTQPPASAALPVQTLVIRLDTLGSAHHWQLQGGGGLHG